MTNDDWRDIVAELEAQNAKLREALQQCATPYFWQKDGFWPDASTPAHKEQELYRRRHVAEAALRTTHSLGR